MNTKKLMTKVTLGAAMILTTATVATTVAIPNVVRADDTVVTDKDAKIYTVYGFNGIVDKASYNDIYGSGLLGDQIFKLRDFEYTSADPYTGVWAVGPNGEKNYDPNSATTEPTTPSTTEPTTPSATDNTQTSGSSATSTESSEASSTEGTGTTGTTSSTTEASQTSVADKGQASTTGAKQDNTTTSSQETKSETSNSSAPVATPTAVNGSKTASSATPAKTNQLPVTGESNLISTIMGITGLTLLLSWFGFKAYRESK
ncbi:LPXTG cell wall anchor domain-containing protein [Streptococcus orisratti]